MKRNLIGWNLLLLVLVIFAGTILKQRWQQTRSAEGAFLNKKLQPIPTPPLPALRPVEAAKPTNYLDVASRMVLARDRNPNIIYDPPPPPPPPKPMPPLPRAFGIIDFGEGPTAILSERAGAASKSYRPGDKVGDFKLVAMTSTELMFDWEGKRFVKSVKELAGAPPQVEQPAEAAAATPPPAQQPQITNVVPTKPGPGASVGGEYRACTPNDTSPSGTVVDGLRKVETMTPFGRSCRWEPAK